MRTLLAVLRVAIWISLAIFTLYLLFPWAHSNNLAPCVVATVGTYTVRRLKSPAMSAQGDGTGLKPGVASRPSLLPWCSFLLRQWWHGLLQRYTYQDNNLLRGAHLASLSALWQAQGTWLRSDPHSWHRPVQSGWHRGFIGSVTIADCRTISVTSKM